MAHTHGMYERYKGTGAPQWLVGTGTATTRIRPYDEESAADEAYTACTYALHAADGTELVATTSLGSGSAIIEHNVTLSGVAPGLARETWVITIDGVTVTRSRLAAIAPVHMSQMVSSSDLMGRHHFLETSLPADHAGWRSAIEAAWDVVTSRAIDALQPAMWTPDHLRLPHLYLSLSIAILDQGAGEPFYLELSDRYERKYEDAWSRMRAHEDTDADGDRDGEASPTVPEDGPGFFGRRG